MLGVTIEAAEFLDQVLTDNKTTDLDVLRLSPSHEGLGLSLSREQEGDQVIEYEERPVLVVEPDVAQGLRGATIDTVDTPEGTRLTLVEGGGE